MSLSRQQKRATLRRLNDPKVMKKTIEAHERAEAKELEIIKQSRKRKLAVVAIAILVGAITLMALFG